jgi:hypothetical protein
VSLASQSAAAAAMRPAASVGRRAILLHTILWRAFAISRAQIGLLTVDCITAM